MVIGLSYNKRGEAHKFTRDSLSNESSPPALPFCLLSRATTALSAFLTLTLHQPINAQAHIIDQIPSECKQTVSELVYRNGEDFGRAAEQSSKSAV
jgi:hypothetical protein